ncbi:MAG: hypothetical protein J6A28_02360, partial [Clostridia bacterium]|nr:hypothetical protein [Clostridia bacterium]
MGEVSYGAMSTCIGLFMMLWPTDIVLILMKKYKVPIAIDLNGEYGIELEKQIEASEMTAEEKEVRKEILEDLDKLKQQTAQQDEKHEMSQLSDSENKQKDTKGKKK